MNIFICTFLVWVLPYQHDHHQIMRNSCYDKLGVGIADTCQANQSTLKWGHNGKATLFLFFQWISFWEIRWQNMKYLSDFFWYFHVTFSDMCPIFAWYPGKMFRAFGVKCRPIFETPADLLHIFATRHYCHLYQSKQHHHNNHHHQNNKHNHQNNKHHQNTTTAATTTKTQPPSQKTLKLWDIESLTPNTDRQGHLMWKKIVQQLVGWAVLHNVQAWWQERPDWCQPRQQQVCKKALIEKAPFLLWIHSMRKCESEKGKIVEINGCERAGNASNILHHCCGSINFSRKNVRNPFQNIATIAQFVQPHCSNILQTLSLLWHDLPLVSVFSATLEFILFLYCIQNNEACQSKTKG